MSSSQTYKPNRTTERIFLTLSTLVLAFLFYELFAVLQRGFTNVPQRLKEGSIVHLNEPQLGDRMQNLLQRGFYFEDNRDIAFIASTIRQRSASNDKRIENIGELNKTKYFVSAEQAYAQGGASFQKRVHLSRQLLGFSGKDSVRFIAEKEAPPALASSIAVASGGGTITAKITNPEGDAVAGVLVRLNMLLPGDSLYGNEAEGKMLGETTAAFEKTFFADRSGARKLQSLTAYARTNANGEVTFSGLPEERSFAVLPLQPGFQFGAINGTVSLKGREHFSFVQHPHTIRLLSAKDFNNLKKEGALIVRTPEEATRWFWIIGICFFAAFWVLHFFLSLRAAAADQFILPIVFLLTGFSLLTLLSIQDPLRDRFLARDMIGYLGIGFAAICALLLFDLRRFTTDSGLYRLFAFKSDDRAASGWPWAFAALLLLVLTILFGSGPEGSGVKVNLAGFQPSELIRFLLLLFLAGFFTTNETFIAGYATAKRRWRFFYTALGAIVGAILLFLILGDLGPAMVVCFTFIVLFSFSRGDFAYAAAAVIVYAVLVWVVKNVWLATGIIALLLAAVFYFVRKQISESAIMAVVVIASFLLLDQVPLLGRIIPGPIQRLTDRKAIWQDAWNNEVFGGDQVANGIWAMASGGIKGQGIGQGFAKTIPEAHTDMILPSFGEELGWAGIICMLLLFVMYLHRALLIGRQSGRPFLFYLSAAIGVSTFVQAVLIAGGSTGALPLSGVALPFVSYGGSSLIINMLAAGFLLSASLVNGSAVQMTYIKQQQDRNLMPALLSAFAGIILISVAVSRYTFNNKRWIVEPALVADRSGARMFSYNPRIDILMNKLQAGTVYDRNGLILATSRPAQLTTQRDSLVGAGIDPRFLQTLAHRRQDRFYPFDAHTFFWTGDANTGVFSGGMNGYFAEYAHGPALRGFHTPATRLDVLASRYREHRFLPQTTQEMSVSRRDFSALSNLLLAGPNTALIDSFKARNRDVQLTIDAALQTGIQQSLQGDETLRKSRVSVVVMEDKNGDVLASALYPLPPVADWDLLTLPAREQAALENWVTTTDLGFTHATQPGSTAKLATALAAFNKLGDAAAQKTFVIRLADLVRTTGDEPDETGTIGMERAIVKSNNPYFIRLANEAALEEDMATIYLQTGMFLRGKGGYYYHYNGGNLYREEAWRDYWRNTEFKSRESYDKTNIHATRSRGISGMAWGQGELIATPASVARLAAGIANGGYLVDNRYVLRISDSLLPVNDSTRIAKKPSYAAQLTSYMQAQSAGKVAKLGMAVAGKTGTPERIVKNRRINDGWYVFFAPKASGEGNIVVCVRIEDTRGSSIAVQVAGQHVIPQLMRHGYFEKK